MAKYLDKAGVQHLVGKIKDGTIVTGKTKEVVEGGKVPASTISGVISLANLPNGALERLTVVENKAARFTLTKNNVQLGDTVKEKDTGLMYLVIDEDNLDKESGYSVYTAGSASSVPWSGITGKPTSLSGFGISDGINAVSNSGIGNAVASLNISGHTIQAALDTFIKSLRIGRTQKKVSTEELDKDTGKPTGALGFSLDEIGQYVPSLDATLPEVVSLLFPGKAGDVYMPAGTSYSGIVFTCYNRENGKLDDQTVQYRALDGKWEWRKFDGTKWSSWVDMNDSALTNEEIDEAIAAAG